MLRLNEFDVVAPETVAEALAVLNGNAGAMVVAGGTDLVPKLKRGQFEPAVLVSLARLRDLDGIESAGDRVSIGALTKLRTIERSGELAAFTALREAVRRVATPIIRNAGTLGGNLLQDTRCRYYDRSLLWRQSIGYCLKKDGDECRVAPGGGKCFATFCSDLAPALVALGAEVTLAGMVERIVPLEGIYNDDGMAYTNLDREILTRVTIRKRGLVSTYRKLRLRDGFDFPEVGVAVAMKRNGGPAEVNIAVTGAGSSLYVLKEKVAESDLPEVAHRVFKSVRPVDTMFFPPAYRKKMVKRLLLQAFDELLSSR
jgi:4-hydroxybenzoyl-CoA reductase subunit beta